MAAVRYKRRSHLRALHVVTDIPPMPRVDSRVRAKANVSCEKSFGQLLESTTIIIGGMVHTTLSRTESMSKHGKCGSICAIIVASSSTASQSLVLRVPRSRGVWLVKRYLRVWSDMAFGARHVKRSAKFIVWRR